MRALIFERRWVVVRKAARERIERAAREGLCVACMQPLDGTSVKRGCHERCYRATLRAVEQGKTTIAERVSAGKLLERSECGRRPSNPVTVELS